MLLCELNATLARLLAVLAVAASAATAVAEPYISEFMASNTATLRDEDQALSDWIEIHNPDVTPFDLNGWYLTDSATNRTKWQFPPLAVPAGGYVVVFASNKNRRDPGRELHTNFALANEGEYLALVRPDGTTVASEFSPAYPAQSADVSYGMAIDAAGQLTAAYFSVPTPGQANGGGSPGGGAPNGGGGPAQLTETVTFSARSGPFSAPFLLELSGASAGRQIRYEAAVPSIAGANVPEPLATSPVYTGPITVEGPLLVRAAVFSDDGTARGRTSSAHYFQIDNTTADSVGSFSTHLPVVVLEQHGFGGLDKIDGEQPVWVYGYQARASGLPLFDSEPDFGLPAIMAVRGTSSAYFAKKSYNVDLRDSLGRKVSRALFNFPDEHEEWALVGPYLYDPSLIRNSYVYALSRRIGRWAPRTQPIEVFLNPNGGPLGASAYAGVYVLTDKVKIAKGRVEIEEMKANSTADDEIAGGYLLKIDTPDPDEFSWISPYIVEETQSESAVIVASPKADKLSAEQRNYIRSYVQSMEDALRADQASGWATRTYLDYIDRPSWVDHHILNTFTMNPDAFERSAYFTKDRAGKLVAGPVWDFDRALGSAADTRGDRWDVWRGENATLVWDFGWWAMIARDPEFMQDWVDRWQSLRRDQFGDENLRVLADQQAAAIGPVAAARDVATWEDNVSRFGGFAGEIEHIKDWVVQRARWIDRQFVAPPQVSVSGGNLIVDPVGGGEIIYTLDGSDPRSLGGGIAPNARRSAARLVVPASSNLQARSYRAEFVDIYPGSPWSSAAGGPNSSPLAPRSRVVNLSSRANVGSGENALIVGIVVKDTAGKRYLARAVGPALAAFGAEGTVPDPQLSIFTQDGVEWFRNNGWQSGPNPAEITQLGRQVGAFPLPAGSNDSALAVRVGAGAYTVQVTTPSGQSGIGLAELYELDTNGRTANLSIRATVGTGDQALIGGFVVQGAAHKRMLIRAVGPTLAGFGVSGALMDPLLTIYSGANVVASNSAWGADRDAAMIAAASESIGAFALGAGSADAALLLTLAPGAYTVDVRSRNEDAGLALLEIYEVP